MPPSVAFGLQPHAAASRTSKFIAKRLRIDVFVIAFTDWVGPRAGIHVLPKLLKSRPLSRSFFLSISAMGRNTRKMSLSLIE